MAQTIKLLDSVTRWLQTVRDPQERYAMMQVMFPQADLDSSQCLQVAGLVISAASNPAAKTGASATYCLAHGVPVAIPAATALTLVGTTPQNTFNVYAFDVDQAGNITCSMGVPAATLAGVVFPPRLQGQARFGLIFVNPTAANFVGGTTALDAANTNVVYVSPTGSFDPSVIVI